MRLRLPVSLGILLLASLSWAQERVSFRCPVDFCKIPQDAEGYNHGTEVCYAREDLKEEVRRVTWVKGKRVGPARCFDKGKVIVDAVYAGDELNGLFVESNYDSRGARVRYLKNNIPHGYEFSVDDNGKVTDMNWCFRDGHAESAELTSCLSEDYGKFGQALNTFQKESALKQKADAQKLAKRMNGPQITKYASGKTRSTYTTKDGKLHGTYKSFLEDGKISQECEYKNDNKDGLCKAFDTAGRLDEKATYSVGKLTSKEIFFDNGKIQQKSHREGESNTFCFTTFYDTGLKELSYCRELSQQQWYGNFIGLYEVWSQNGTKIITGTYEMGRESGEWKRFHDDGSLQMRTFYEKGILLKSVEYLFYKKEGSAFTPYIHRLEKEYFPDGSLKKETELRGHDDSTKPMVI